MEIKPTDTIVIYDWMRSIGLHKLNYVMTYAIIYKFCQNGQTMLRYDICKMLARYAMCSISEATEALNTLRDKDLIVETEVENCCYISLQ